jgi:plasmid stabilization system protein ParE
LTKAFDALSKLLAETQNELAPFLLSFADNAPLIDDEAKAIAEARAENARTASCRRKPSGRFGHPCVYDPPRPSRRSSRDLRAIKDYLEPLKPNATRRVFETIKSKIATLETFPQIGEIVDEHGTRRRKRWAVSVRDILRNQRQRCRHHSRTAHRA